MYIETLDKDIAQEAFNYGYSVFSAYDTESRPYYFIKVQYVEVADGGKWLNLHYKELEWKVSPKVVAGIRKKL